MIIYNFPFIPNSCIKILIEKQADLSLENALIKRTIPEVILAFKKDKTDKSKRDIVALNLFLEIGQRCQSNGALNDFIDVLLAGLGGDKLLIMNTIRALKVIVQNFTGNLTVATLQFLLETVLAFLVGRSQEEAKEAVAFVYVFAKVLPVPLVANHLPNIVRSLSSMTDNSKKYCREKFALLLEKLCKRFTAEEIIKLVPGNDEKTHKRLKNIRKEMNRKKKQRLEKETDEDDDEMDTGLEKKSPT